MTESTRTMQTTSAAPIAAPNPMSLENIPPEVLQLAAALWASTKDSGGMQALTQADALAAAVYSKQTGDVFGQDAYIGTQGNVKGKIMQGYRSVQNRVETPYFVKYRPLTGQEAGDNEIVGGMRALICDVYVLDVWRRCQKMNVAYEPVHGLGIITSAETQGACPVKGKSWRWVLEKRARKDALRQLPPWAKDAFDWQDGDDEDENALTRELAAADATGQAVVAAARRDPIGNQTRAARNVADMRGPAGFEGLDDDDPNDAAEAPTAWDAMTSASAERPAAAPKTAETLGPQVSNPDPPVMPKPTGPIRPAAIDGAMFQTFNTWAACFAADNPHWQNKSGKADFNHLCISIARSGYERVTAAAWEAIQVAMTDRAQKYAAPSGK